MLAIVAVLLTITGATLATVLPSAPQMVKDLNVGLVAVLVNVVVLGAVSALTRRPAVAPVLRPVDG